MHVTIHTQHLDGAETPISDSAANLVRMQSFPLDWPRVARIKALTAALISECEAIREMNPAAGRAASIAITAAQDAGMWAVNAATEGQ